ncbi:MAG: amino acid racemase [Firmicutes bacterium]|nr:amino acid racemase [Bacillota bacterium]
MKNKIGIIGGISHESTMKYYELIHKKYYEQNNDYYYPEVVIYSLDFQKFTDFEDNNNMEGYIEYISSGVRALVKAGVDFIIMAANSPHSVYEEIEAYSEVPMISIAEVTAKNAKKRGIKKSLLLGIKYTMQSSFYQNICKKYGIEIIVPIEKEQDRINEIIFDELTIGIIRDDSKTELLKIINNYDVEGVILGCTELPLIIKEEDTDTKLLNTVELHVEAVLNY